ncbi:MAG: sirohydrochlorin cobaltochelatase [Lachnospiraceae bacterium]|nr:sirohydrochlorin cobaltochelatase [Lachnospiraceae bacterium]
MENLRNENDIGRKEILVVSFGTTFKETRIKTIGAIEDAVEKAFGDYSVRRAFTSRFIRSRLADRDGIIIDSPGEALERAKANGVKELIIQPTHLMAGKEYHKLTETIDEYAGDFESISLGCPLLDSDEDFITAARAIRKELPLKDDKTAIVLMGHGTDAPSNSVYEKLQEVLNKSGADAYYIATVEGTPTIRDILKRISGYSNILLAPFMVVAGDHAINDLAGEKEDSWKNILLNSGQGFNVETVLRGIGEWKDIQELFVKHIEKAELFKAVK